MQLRTPIYNMSIRRDSNFHALLIFRENLFRSGSSLYTTEITWSSRHVAENKSQGRRV